MDRKRYIYYFLLFITMVMVMAPAIPHHHHGNGIICMKDDVKENDCCSTHHHHHHHQEDDPCCNDDCVAHFNTLIRADVDHVQPEFHYLITLFTEPLTLFLSRKEEKAVCWKYVYIESLHSTYITRAAGLRAPPSLV